MSEIKEEKVEIKIHRRTFEAKNFPRGSRERIELNESSLTSEYEPSRRFIVERYYAKTATHRAHIRSECAETRKQAEEIKRLYEENR